MSLFVPQALRQTVGKVALLGEEIQRTAAPSGERLSRKGSSLNKSQANLRASRQGRLSEQVLYFTGRQEQTRIPTSMASFPSSSPLCLSAPGIAPRSGSARRKPSGPPGPRAVAPISPCSVPGLAGWSSPGGCCRCQCCGRRGAACAAAFWPGSAFFCPCPTHGAWAPLPHAIMVAALPTQQPGPAAGAHSLLTNQPTLVQR